MFGELHGYCLQQQGFNISLWRSPIVLAIAQVLWKGRGSHGTPLINNPIRCNPFPIVEALLGDKRYSLGVVSPVVCSFPLDCLCVCVCVLIIGSLYCIRFPCDSSSGHSFSCPSFISSSLPLLVLFSYSCPPTLPVQNCLFYFPFLGRSIAPPVSLPFIYGHTDCTLFTNDIIANTHI